MGMSRVGSPWRVADDTGGQAERFVTYQKPAFDPRDRGWLPGQVTGLQGKGFGQVRTERHRHHPVSFHKTEWGSPLLERVERQNGKRLSHMGDPLDLLGHEMREIVEVFNVEFDQQVV